MTVDDLLASCRRNSTGPVSRDALSPPNLSEFLRFALGLLLEDIDYDGDRRSSGAIAARVIAGFIDAADQIAARTVH